MINSLEYPSSSSVADPVEGDDDWCHFADVTENMSELYVCDGEDSSMMTGLNRNPVPLPQQQQQQQPQQQPQEERLHASSSSSSIVTHQFEMPPQLHPAVSLGVRRISSCYFSLGSQESMSDLLSHFNDSNNHNEDTSAVTDNRNFTSKADVAVSDWTTNCSSGDILYHDILMQVFTFLDASSLARFSETAKRPNFEVFYYLQLQLQQALLEVSLEEQNNIDNEDEREDEREDQAVNHDEDDNDENDEDDAARNSDNNNKQDDQYYDYYSLSTIACCASVSRLATLNPGLAKEILTEYLESNSTLRTMPLSYSMAYARHFLLHSGLHRMFFLNNNNEKKKKKNSPSSSQALATSAALFMTIVGAASLVSTVSGGDTTTMMTTMTNLAETASSTSELLPNVLFRVGMVGSLMGAARQMSDTEQRAAMRETAEQMARSMQELPAATLMMMRGNQHQQQDEEHTEATAGKARPSQFRFPSLFEMREMLQATLGNLATRQLEQQQQKQQTIVLSNPYDHLPVHTKENEENVDDDDENDVNEEKTDEKHRSFVSSQCNKNIHTSVSTDRKIPSGCVGAYYRAIHKSTHHVTRIVKESRKGSFHALSAEKQRQRSLEFLSACSSNDSLDRVKEMITTIDVDGFFVGNDGTETCALHTASFHGADKVVEFLCSGIDEQDPTRDGGLCEINCRDSNGWTAMHFAAGANSVGVVRVLVSHGAWFKVEAHNGYTPLQWATRLSNDQVAEELTMIMTKSAANQGAWMSCHPLSSIACRFFSLIPTQ